MIDRLAGKHLLLVNSSVNSSNSTLIENQSLAANKLTDKHATMADRAATAAIMASSWLII